MPSPTTVIPAPRRTVRVVDDPARAPEGTDLSAARRVLLRVPAAVTAGEVAGRRASYSMLFIDPMVDLVSRSGGSVGGWLRPVKVGAIGLTAETVPEPASGQQHQGR